jgi:ABC-type ATPase involved in cell division
MRTRQVRRPVVCLTLSASQPDDDLDNMLIYDLVVSTLKQIKTGRQVIVVTHNANVVVNADTEHVTICVTELSHMLKLMGCNPTLSEPVLDGRGSVKWIRAL